LCLLACSSNQNSMGCTVQLSGIARVSTRFQQSSRPSI
jgi:hypothetical protein